MKKMNFIFGFVVIAIFCFANINAQSTAIINIDSTQQHISGFGAANILPWRPDMTDSEIEKAFGTGDGQIGFSILRLRLPSDENSFALNLPTAKKAHQMGVTLMASPWSPPAMMKSNNNTVGGELMESQYDDFAAYINKFSDYMEENGAPIYAISVQNEPDIQVSYESCDYTVDQMLKFVKENSQTIESKVIAPESYHFAKSMSDPLLNDNEAVKNFDIVGGHIYGGGLNSYPLAAEKGKEVWMTEHLILETDWATNLSTGKDMLDCMNSGMSAYIWWYIVRFYGPIYDDGSHADTPAGAVQGEISKRGFVMSQFARFIRPGYFRVECTRIPQRDVYLSAFKDSLSSKLVIVAINTASSEKTQTFTFENASAEKFISYVTSNTKNCVQEDDYSALEGSFTVTLEPSSITTFVSSDFAVSVNENIRGPEQFKLFQNFPNPFNPTTQIEYSIPENNHISLKVYNVLGSEVANLYKGFQSAGNHSVTFSAANLAGGVYYYRLETENFSETKKLILLK